MKRKKKRKRRDGGWRSGMDGEWGFLGVDGDGMDGHIHPNFSHSDQSGTDLQLTVRTSADFFDRFIKSAISIY